MNKSFYLDICTLLHHSQLPQAKLPGRDNPLCPHLLQKRGPITAAQCHLGTHMKLQLWKMLPDKAQYSQILYNHGIQPRFVKRKQIVIQLRDFFLFQERIYSQIYLPSQQMCVSDTRHKGLRCEIISICPGAETAPSQVDRIRSCMDGAVKSFLISGG